MKVFNWRFICFSNHSLYAGSANSVSEREYHRKTQCTDETHFLKFSKKRQILTTVKYLCNKTNQIIAYNGDRDLWHGSQIHFHGCFSKGMSEGEVTMILRQVLNQ